MSAKTPDPFYDRKPVPKELIDGIGYTGLTSAEESNSRERKFSTDKGDLRKFSNPKMGKQLDPFYQRKPVPDALIHGVGDTGLSREEEFLNRERKYSASGVDVRKFGKNSGSGFHPSSDPYYGRKQVAAPEIDGVGETNMTPAEAFESRETKTHMFDLSSDPFSQITGRGHRASISNPAAVEAVIDVQRRRSSAVAPHHVNEAHHHSGYDGDNKLAPIESRTDEPPRPAATDGIANTGTDTTNPATTTTTTTTTTTATHVTNGGTGAGHTQFYNDATRGLDEVGPHDRP